MTSIEAVAVVTGGARRLGAATVLALAEAGYAVTINYRTSGAAAEATADAVRRAGGRALTMQGDMTDPVDVARLLDTTLEHFQRIAVLVANVGSFRRTPLATLSETDWDDMLADNLRTAFLCAQRFGLHMRAHGGGVIIMLADIAGERPWADYLPYSIAKAGVIALTRGLAVELAPAVRVNAIAPGPVLFPEDYDVGAQDREIARTLLQRQGRPENVAQAVLALVGNDYITGVVLPVDGGRALA